MTYELIELVPKKNICQLNFIILHSQNMHDKILSTYIKAFLVTISLNNLRTCDKWFWFLDFSSFSLKVLLKFYIINYDS